MGDLPLPSTRFVPPTVRSIARDRVDRLLDRAWSVPLTTVIGPAGAGKTTAAGHLVHRAGNDAVWYRAHPVDGEESTFTEHLAQSIARVTGNTGAHSGLMNLFVDVERTVDRLLVVIDEFDALIGTATERAFDEVLADLSPSVHFVSLSRHRPSVNLSRLRLGPGLGEVGPDDLRFRSWEVDRLFRELYRRPLLPDEVADLERRTGGWVAALQLFNLATTALPAAERHAAIAHVGRRNGPDWDFLADNVLKGLPDELQLFLLETAPLERLTASLCDELLNEHSSAVSLAELERLQLVTSSMEGPGTFRSHEVLRHHLDGLLMEWEGADAVRKRYRQAAETLESHGHFAEALRAYCRGEDWSSASRLLGSRGAEVADRAGSWLVGLPAAMVRGDPWLLLAEARRQRGEGRLTDAIETYQQVELGALTSMPVTVARRERLLLSSMFDPSSSPSLAWVGALRDALVGDPIEAIAGLGNRSAHDLLASGLGQLLAGEVRSAAALLRRTGDRADASPVVSVVAQLGLLVADHLAGRGDPFVADDLERAAMAVEVPLLVRLCRAATAMVTGTPELADAVVDESERAGDATGAAIAALLAALGRISGPAAPGPVPADALDRCSNLGLRTLEVWAQVAVAIGAIGTPDGPRLAVAAEAAARRRGLRALQRLAELGIGATSRNAADTADLAAAFTAAHGIAVPAALVPRPARSPDRGLDVMAGGATAALRVRCLGPFSVAHGAVTIDLTDLRPRARTVLRMLAANLGAGVHRQTLCDQLWPDDDETAAGRKLQVAISSIRRALEQAGTGEVLRRRDEVYLLDPEVVGGDVQEFTAAVAAGRLALARGAAGDAEPALRRAQQLYAGDLLPEDGAGEWVVTARQQLQAAATDVAHALGSLLLAAHPAEAVSVSRWGLAVDRFHDPLWRLLLDALRADHDHAGHARALAGYDEVLDELGVRRPANGAHSD